MIYLAGTKRELAMATYRAETVKAAGVRQKELRPPHSSYAHLTTMLAQGWRLEPPVYIRPRWRSRLRAGEENIYHFVLWHGNRVNLVSVPDCPQVQQFLADNNLAVDSL